MNDLTRLHFQLGNNAGLTDGDVDGAIGLGETLDRLVGIARRSENQADQNGNGDTTKKSEHLLSPLGEDSFGGNSNRIGKGERVTNVARRGAEDPVLRKPSSGNYGVLNSHRKKARKSLEPNSTEKMPENPRCQPYVLGHLPAPPTVRHV